MWKYFIWRQESFTFFTRDRCAYKNHDEQTLLRLSFQKMKIYRKWYNCWRQNKCSSFFSQCLFIGGFSKNAGGSKFHRLEKNVVGSVRVYRYVHIYFRKYHARFEKNSQILQYPPTWRVGHLKLNIRTNDINIRICLTIVVKNRCK